MGSGAVDVIGFGDGGVIFPEEKHRVGIIFEFRSECEGGTICINGADGRTCGVDRDSGEGIFILIFKYGRNEGFYRLKVVCRMLAQDIFRGIAVTAFCPSRIGENALVEDISFGVYFAYAQLEGIRVMGCRTLLSF